MRQSIGRKRRSFILAPAPSWFSARAAHDREHQTKASVVPAHGCRRGARITPAQRAQQRPMMRKVPRVIEALVLGRYIGKPCHLRLVEHGHEQRVSGACEQEGVERVVRGLGRVDVLPGDRRFQLSQPCIKLAQLGIGNALRGKLGAFLRNVRAHLVCDRRRLDQNTLVEDAFAALPGAR